MSEKDISEYYKNERGGFATYCKECVKKERKLTYIKNCDAEKVCVIKKVCGNCKKEKPRTGFHKAKDTQDGLSRKCKQCKAKSAKQDRKNNKKRIQNYNYKYQKDKRANNPLFKLKDNISCLIRNSLKTKSIKKNTRTKQILGVDYKHFKKYLENNPYGFKVGQEGIDIDHIVPISSIQTEEEAYELNHYTNFQLLPSEYNRWVKKNSVFDKDDFEIWLEKYKDV